MRVAKPFAKASGVNGFSSEARSAAEAAGELGTTLDASAADAEAIAGMAMVMWLAATRSGIVKPNVEVSGRCAVLSRSVRWTAGLGDTAYAQAINLRENAV